MPLTFRPAQPEDAEHAVPLIHSSGPAAFDYVFRHRHKGSAQDFLRTAFVSGVGQFGYQRHWVGELDGRIVAVGTAFSGEVNLGNMLTVTRQIFAFYGPWSAWSVIRKGLQMEQLVKPPAKDLLYLAHLGVQPGLTGQGIGTRLIEHLLQQGRAQGSRKAALDVSAGNPLAQALYQRLGFCVHDERRSRLAGIADHRYMERPL